MTERILALMLVSITVTPALAVQAGDQLYSGNCQACHQDHAQGLPGLYPSLVGSPVLLGDSGDLARWVTQGKRPASMPAGRFPTLMPVFKSLRDDDAAALFTYLRSNFGNAAPPVNTATVARARGH